MKDKKDLSVRIGTTTGKVVGKVVKKSAPVIGKGIVGAGKGIGKFFGSVVKGYKEAGK